MRIAEVLKDKEIFKEKKAFIAFITCGDPDLETTEKLIVEIEKNGADLIELGIPFSDPTAEGPVIQEANMRSLSAGTTTDLIFDMVQRVRGRVKIPLVFMTYANVVFSYGTERFIKKASEIGINGLILPDVPFEEREEFSTVCEAYSLDYISLIAPTSNDRISMIAREAKGFVCCVSSLGVAGEKNQITTDAAAMVELVREATNTPSAVGFGIATPDQAQEVSQKADGIIIGSAIVKLIGEYGRDCVPHVGEYVKKIRLRLQSYGSQSQFL